MGGVAERVALAGIVAGASAVVSIANLAGSIRVLDLTGSAFMLSLSVLLYNVAFTIMSWVWPAIFLGRVSRRGMLAFALGGMAAGLALMGIPPVPALVIVGSGVVGASSALISPVMMTIMADYYGKDSLAVTKYNTYSSAGFVLGYVAAALIRMRVGTPDLLMASAATSAVLVVLTVLIPQRYVIVEPRRVTYISLIPQLTGRLRPLPSVLFSPRIVYNLRRLATDFIRMVRRNVQRRLPLTLMGTAVLFIAISLFFTPMPAFMRSVGLNDVEVYVTYLTSSIVSTLTYRVVHPIISDYRRAWKLLIVATTTRAPLFLLPMYVLLLEGRIPALPVILTGFVVVGLTWTAISSSLTAVILAMSEKERKDERLGHLNAMIGLGTIVGSLASGIIVKTHGYVALSVTASVLVVTATAIYYRARKALVT